MPLTFLRSIFGERAGDEAFVWRGESYTYAWLAQRADELRESFAQAGIGPGSIVVLRGGFSPNAMATLLALIELHAVAALIAPNSDEHADAYIAIAQAEWIVRCHGVDEPQLTRTDNTADHDIYATLRDARRPGLVLFSSGSTSEPKAVVHDVTRLMLKYQTRRKNYRTLAFLLFDHIGGVDTLFYCLSNGSCLILCDDRTPEGVCELVQRHGVEVLPVAPSFLNLMGISGVWRDYDLSSLRFVTYGAEMMPQHTLDRCREMFPGVEIIQKYGTSEVGTLRSQSRSSDSLWVKIGGEGYETRVVDGRLQIKAESSMLGYLNAPSPFTDDGWFMTGDMVEVDGDYVRFLGRDSDIINVGGRKVYPAEVEAVIAQMPEVLEVAVFGQANAILGSIVCATVRTADAIKPAELTQRVRAFLKDRVEDYKVPMKIETTTESLTTDRFKTMRRATPPSSSA
ncbi:MAG: AMP-binding protein [Phycisphaera sp.]|nr:AMP-binding protein [Phycisphaera sp.]